MRLKLDENLGNRGAEILRDAGHDVATVAGQGLASSSDTTLIEICRKENRALVTLDVDFANPLSFDPGRYAGIAVLRLPAEATAEDLLATIETLRQGLSRNELSGKLWVIQRGRVREYQPEPPDNP